MPLAARRPRGIAAAGVRPRALPAMPRGHVAARALAGALPLGAANAVDNARSGEATRDAAPRRHPRPDRPSRAEVRAQQGRHLAPLQPLRGLPPRALVGLLAA